MPSGITEVERRAVGRFDVHSDRLVETEESNQDLHGALDVMTGELLNHGILPPKSVAAIKKAQNKRMYPQGQIADSEGNVFKYRYDENGDSINPIGKNGRPVATTDPNEFGDCLGKDGYIYDKNYQRFNKDTGKRVAFAVDY